MKSRLVSIPSRSESEAWRGRRGGLGPESAYFWRKIEIKDSRAPLTGGARRALFILVSQFPFRFQGKDYPTSPACARAGSLNRKSKTGRGGTSSRQPGFPAPIEGELASRGRGQDKAQHRVDFPGMVILRWFAETLAELEQAAAKGSISRLPSAPPPASVVKHALTAGSILRHQLVIAYSTPSKPRLL